MGSIEEEIETDSESEIRTLLDECVEEHLRAEDHINKNLDDYTFYIPQLMSISWKKEFNIFETKILGELFRQQPRYEFNAKHDILKEMVRVKRKICVIYWRTIKRKEMGLGN
jgi:hypothetical protein